MSWFFDWGNSKNITIKELYYKDSFLLKQGLAISGWASLASRFCCGHRTHMSICIVHYLVVLC